MVHSTACRQQGGKSGVSDKTAPVRDRATATQTTFHELGWLSDTADHLDKVHITAFMIHKCCHEGGAFFTDYSPTTVVPTTYNLTGFDFALAIQTRTY